MNPFRRRAGGRIDRTRTFRFTFDGRPYEGHPGDTLASALLANGIRIVGRSFKYHRPRGIVSAGPEEPNALLRVGTGDIAVPNSRATMVELRDGLFAESQNRWPSLRYDAGALAGLAAPFLPAGFYYKTFKHPGRAWMTYERLIRRAAGLGRGVPFPDPDRYEMLNEHVDVLVVGAGPAGLATARAAGTIGADGRHADVLVVDERPRLGGSLRYERRTIDGSSPERWIAGIEARRDWVGRILTRTTAFGFYDDNLVACVEQIVPENGRDRPRERLRLVRAKVVVLATGAIERPFAFANGDRPGVMLAAAARTYVNEYAVLPGSRAVIATNNDDAWRTALDLAEAGIDVAGVVDARREVFGPLAAAVAARGIAVHLGATVAGARGGSAVQGAVVTDLAGTRIADLDCDLLAISGGWSPAVHLHSQSGGKTLWRDDIAAFVPGAAKQRTLVAGAANGTFVLAEVIAEAARAGAEARMLAGLPAIEPTALPQSGPDPEPANQLVALWAARKARGVRGKRFVDIQNDVTDADLHLAVRENYRSIEHVKRYTTLGLGTDQGKTGNVIGAAIVAEARGEPIAAVGTTTFRPPWTPVTLGALAGPETGREVAQTRLTPMHEWHAAHGAIFVEVGLWLRPRAYPRPGESFDAAWRREVLAVREAAGLCDVSTLGKIVVEGPDALAFLERVYCNPLASLAVGRCRYGLMLRDDGMVLDDGTIARVATNRFVVTTTTANAGRVLAHMEFLAATAWPELALDLTSTTDVVGQMSLAGPASRAVLAAATDADVSDTGLPHLGTQEARIAGVPVRLFRLSYSGERAYEIAAPADRATAVWEAVLAAGEPHGIAPYGSEALAALRIEKGHVAGVELDGRTTPDDLRMGRLVSQKKSFVGRAMLRRPALQAPSRKRLVGLESVDGAAPIPGGAQIVADPAAKPPVAMLGHVTSTTWSPTLQRPIALALLSGGLDRKGEELVAAAPLTGAFVKVKVVEPCHLDPKGERMHG